MAHDYFRALRDVALVINSSLEPREVLHKITEQTAATMGCKASTIRLLDSTGRFNGEVTAKRRVVVYSTGVLEGQVTTPNLLTEEGGVIEGQISMKTPAKPKA